MFALLASQKNWHFHFLPEENSTHAVFKSYFLAGGISITAIFFAIYLGQDGYFTKVFKMVIDAHEVWGNPFPKIFPFFDLLKEVGYHQIFERALFYLPILTYGIVTAFLFYQLILKKKTRNR